MKNIFISFVIPAKNEEGSLEKLSREILAVSTKLKKKVEIIFVDDGSTDDTYKILKRLHKKNKVIKVIKLRGWYGKSIALQTGFSLAKGKLICTMDADLQDKPSEIPKFLKKIEEGYDLVSGWKKKRYDPLMKVIPSRILNFVTAYLTGVKIHDINCGFKLYKKEVVEKLNLYGELYRFIPVLAAKQNYKVGEVEVHHQPRKFGKSKFGIGRNIKGLLDLITIIFLTGYFRRPGHFFGSLGLLSFFLGFLIGTYITFLRITTGTIQYRQPLLFLGVLLMIIGIQLVSTGLLAEMITYTSLQKTDINENISEILK